MKLFITPRQAAYLVCFAGLLVLISVTGEKPVEGQPGSGSRPNCQLRKGGKFVTCPFCKILGAKPNCPYCKGANRIQCPGCRGTGKAIILSDIVPQRKQKACGIHKLTPNEQYTLMLEIYGLLNDRWASAAGKYFENNGWTKATVIKEVKNLLLVQTEYGMDIVPEPILSNFGLFSGSAVWLEGTAGMVDVVDENGDKGSYMVR